MKPERYVAIGRRVYLRDGGQCRGCGAERSSGGQSLEDHHLVPRRIAPERSLDIDNVMQVCRQCHVAAEWEFRRQYAINPEKAIRNATVKKVSAWLAKRKPKRANQAPCP